MRGENMAATLRGDILTGAGPTIGSAEGGMKWNTEDTVTGTTSGIAIPQSTGTNYSWKKSLGLNVTASSTTTLKDRKIRWATSPAAGLAGFFKDGGAVGTYTQSSGANKPADSGSDGPATPATYTALTTSFQTWDAAEVSTGSTGINGNIVVTAFGVDSTYAGGPGTNQASPNLELQYTEF